MLQNFDSVILQFGLGFSFFFKYMTKVDKSNTKAIKTTKKAAKSKAELLENLIWEQKEQCESVCEINRGLIAQYCRFAIMADDLSLRVEQDLQDDEVAQSKVMARVELYEKVSKQAERLFRLLGLNAIKDQLASKRNQFLAALEDDN